MSLRLRLVLGVFVIFILAISIRQSYAQGEGGSWILYHSSSDNKGVDKESKEKFEKEHAYTAFGSVKSISLINSVLVMEFQADNGVLLKLWMNNKKIELPGAHIRMMYKQLYFKSGYILFEILAVDKVG